MLYIFAQIPNVKESREREGANMVLETEEATKREVYGRRDKNKRR